MVLQDEMPTDATPTEEQDELRRAVRRAFTDATARSPVPPRFESVPVPLDAGLWATFAGMDLLGLGVPEEAGGTGGGVLDLCVLLEEAGAAVAAVPVLGTAAVTSVLAAHAGDPAVHRLLDAVVTGALVATPAWETFPDTVVPGRRPDALSAEDGRVRGRLATVAFGTDADVVLAVAHHASGDPVAVLLDLRGDGVTRSPVPSLDLSEPMAALTVDAAPMLVLPVPAALPVARVLVLAAAELVGTARRAVDDAVAHALIRTQFGRPIGSFQALKHMLADRFVELDAARLLVHDAALLLDRDTARPGPDPDATVAAARTALSAALAAADAAARDGLQVHGGIGFTWEQASHVLVRRARARRTLFGPPARLLDALADHVLAG